MGRARQSYTALGNRLFSSSISKNATVGFVGLGNMGLPMATNLAKNWGVIAFDANEDSMQQAAKAGIEAADSVEEIGASNCDVIFTMLPGCNAVNAVTPLLLENASSSSSIVFVDCSTVHPSTSRRWNDEIAAKGHARIDAPVSGGVKGAQDGTLTFMVGCQEKSALEKTQPHFDCMGQKTIDCGGPGAGAVVKLCNNLALAAQMIGICEALNLGDSLGVDPVVLADVMNTSTAKCWSCEVNNPHPDVALAKGGLTPAAKDYKGGFGTGLMLKDLSLALSAGSDAGVSLPLGSTSKELYKLADAHGLGAKDFGVMLQFLRGK